MQATCVGVGAPRYHCGIEELLPSTLSTLARTRASAQAAAAEEQLLRLGAAGESRRDAARKKRSRWGRCLLPMPWAPVQQASGSKHFVALTPRPLSAGSSDCNWNRCLKISPPALSVPGEEPQRCHRSKRTRDGAALSATLTKHHMKSCHCWDRLLYGNGLLSNPRIFEAAPLLLLLSDRPR